MAGIIKFSGGKTERSDYYCDTLIAGCILMRSLAAPCSWREVEMILGMRDYALSEVVWESLEAFIETYGNIITTLRSDFLVASAEYFENIVHENGTRLVIASFFIDCTQIAMKRPGAILLQWEKEVLLCDLSDH